MCTGDAYSQGAWNAVASRPAQSMNPSSLKGWGPGLGSLKPTGQPLSQRSPHTKLVPTQPSTQTSQSKASRARVVLWIPPARREGSPVPHRCAECSNHCLRPSAASDSTTYGQGGQGKRGTPDPLKHTRLGLLIFPIY